MKLLKSALFRTPGLTSNSHAADRCEQLRRFRNSGWVRDDACDCWTNTQPRTCRLQERLSDPFAPEAIFLIRSGKFIQRHATGLVGSNGRPLNRRVARFAGDGLPNWTQNHSHHDKQNQSCHLNFAFWSSESVCLRTGFDPPNGPPFLRQLAMHNGPQTTG